MSRTNSIAGRPTQRRVKELLDYCPQTGEFTWLVRRGKAKAGSRAGTVQPTTGHRVIGIDNRQYLEQQLAWLIMNGEWPANIVTHLDKDVANNKFSNLFHGTRTEAFAAVNPAAK